ncbi:uncharacterized protein At1g76070-like [Rhodamnia argentea]|uniref:Uncharacterized protein At1g76070-like n=1 Tax=Rhodamnia argentea TaxID=178133 RepID=A0A8B8NXR8_9MYRT|nr:uncharacterized protein At1g76070-like [Rhodamnia argentea]
MEKSQAKPKSKKVLKFLPRTASSVSFFRNPPFSPGRDKRSSYSSELVNSTKCRLRSHVGKGFSGPLVSLIPNEARAASKNDRGFDVNEPTSPKVSCMGQIKHKHKTKKSQSPSADKRSSFSSSTSSSYNKLNRDADKPPRQSNSRELKKQSSTLKRLFSRARGGNKKKGSDASGNNCRKPPLLPDRAPSLSQMERFASGRDAQASFDWSAEFGPVLDADHRDYYHYYSDEERRESDQEEEEEVIIPFSAPIPAAGGGGGRVNPQPRKEINLWKRRTMAPPRPLQLHQPAMVRAN